jgi:aryl-alcohol dehydrogenase-like predicted oxidoreductase
MEKNNKQSVNRRSFIKKTSSVALGLAFAPYISGCKMNVEKPVVRQFGRIGREVTSFGLGGQASLQWTPDDVDPVKIILKAFDLGINYYDTSNLYGPSQLNFGKAFRELNLIPGTGYNEGLRKSIFLTSKTHLRWGKGLPEIEGVTSWSNGGIEGGTVKDVKRSLSQMFGDGQGNYPKGAFLDMVLIHNLNTMQEVDALYTGLYDTDPNAENIGALAALRDLRDGTNLTGLNPEEEKLINHIGFSGHFSSPVMMEMIHRDKIDLLDGMLVAINSNDRLQFNMQYNVIPIAEARDMGIIAMKVFADGAMYTKEATWSNIPEHVIRTVGSKEVPSKPLVEYALSTPGIDTAIIGIGEISDDPAKCQLKQNLASAQIKSDGLSWSDRKEVEDLTKYVKDGKTNYFQLEGGKIPGSPRNIALNQQKQGEKRIVELIWDTAYAGDEPLKYYEIYRDNEKIGRVDHSPQISSKRFNYKDEVEDGSPHEYKVVTIDFTDRNADSKTIVAETFG